MDASRRAHTPAAAPSAWARLGAMGHNTALLAFALQISLVYGIAGLYKVQGTVWQEGTAIYYAFRGGQFVVPGLTELLYRNAFVVTFFTYTTVAFQVAFPFLLFLNRHTRRVAVALGLLFHVGIALFLGLISFSLFMASVDLALMDDDEYRSLWRWLKQWRQRFATLRPPSATAEPVARVGSPTEPQPPA
jgi:hypothetical protein